MFLLSRDQPTHDHLLSIYLKSSSHHFSGKKGSAETILKACTDIMIDPSYEFNNMQIDSSHLIQISLKSEI